MKGIKWSKWDPIVQPWPNVIDGLFYVDVIAHSYSNSDADLANSLIKWVPCINPWYHMQLYRDIHGSNR